MTRPDPHPDAAAPAAGAARGRAARGELDCSALGHLFGFMTSLADARLRKAFSTHMRPLKLRPVEFTVLALLASNQQVTQKRLCTAMATPAPNLAVILARLQDRGLLHRVRSEDDRREQYVELTPEGRSLARRSHDLSHAMEADILAALSAGEQLLLYELLHKIARGR